MFPFGVAGATLFPREDTSTFTKDAYNAQVKRNRKEYVHRYFSGTLDALYAELKTDATNMKPCRREVVFEVPEGFDFAKTEAVLCAYFIDLGYKPLLETSAPVSRNVENKRECEEEKNKLIITIT